MTDHSHSHDCDQCPERALVVGPFTSRPALIVVITRDDLDTGTALIQSDVNPDRIPHLLRGLADRVERQNKARLS